MLRPAVFVTTLSSAALGAQVARHDGYFQWGYYGLTLLGVLFGHIGLNVDNDYRDHMLGADASNPNPTAFSGGSRILQTTGIDAKMFRIISFGGFTLCALTGCYLAYARGWLILVIGWLAGGLIYFYSSKLAYVGYGLGEIGTFVASGPLLVCGAYYVQAQTFSPGVWLCSLTSGFGIANIVLINEFPDYEGDKRANKNTLAVCLGRRRAVTVFIVLWILTYAPIVIGVWLRVMPQLTLLVLLSIPLAVKAVQITRANYDHPTRLLPANLMTILLHMINVLLLMNIYAIDGQY
jgi:1,4-dihydroxy-2-naphthoate octaprenyltransferase